VPVAEPRDLVGAVTRVAHDDQPAVREPHPHHPQELAQELGGGAVRPPALPVVLRAAVQRHQHRQGPGPGGERETHQDGEDDPLVAVPPGGVAVAGADRVAVPGLAVDALTWVAVDGIVTGQEDRLVGGHQRDDEAAEATGQPHGGPGGGGEDALVGCGVAVGDGRDDAEQVGDGPSPGAQQRGAHQQGEATEGRPGEGGSEGLEDREGLIR
jgi:hypothetical protein